MRRLGDLFEWWRLLMRQILRTVGARAIRRRPTAALLPTVFVARITFRTAAMKCWRHHRPQNTL